MDSQAEYLEAAEIYLDEMALHVPEIHRVMTESHIRQLTAEQRWLMMSRVLAESLVDVRKRLVEELKWRSRPTQF